MKPKTLGKIASEMWFGTMDTSQALWRRIAAAVVAEHERRKWQPIATLPSDGEVIAGFYEGDEWVQCVCEAEYISFCPEYTHWQPAPDGPKP